jgi:hypothetical protein
MNDEDTAFETELAIRAKQQAPFRHALQTDIEKLAMFDELVEALAEVTFDYRNQDSPFWNDKLDILNRAYTICDKA